MDQEQHSIIDRKENTKSRDADASQQHLLTRRRFLHQGLALCTALCVGGIAYDTRVLDLTHHRLPIPGLRQPCRLVQLSDLHRSWCVPEAFISQIITRTNALKPDVVLLSGDFVTSHSHYIESCARQIKRLQAPLGLYGVLGNHDYKCDNWHGSPAVVEGLNMAGVQMLTNRSERLDNGLHVVGVDDFDTGAPDPDMAFSKVKRGEPVIAMTHNPLMFTILCAYRCVTLAGHTHGGQINLPLITPLMTDERARYMRGWFQEPGWPGRMYVSRGLGVMTVPFRINSSPEIAVFDLVPS